MVVEEATGTVVVAPRRRRRWPWVIGFLLIAGAIGAWAITRSDTSPADTEPAAQVNTGEVVQTDLVELTTYAGTLGRVAGDPVTSAFAGTVTSASVAGDTVGQGDVLFGIDGEPILLLLGSSPAYRTIASSEGTISVFSSSNGTLTSIADEGDTLELGDVAFVVGDEPTFVLYGNVPVWRTLGDGVDDGPDVQQLEQSLVDLGYDPDEVLTVDEEFTSNTTTMVERWQEDVGIEEDGDVDLGEIVFVPGPSEVMTVPASAGQPVISGQIILEVGDGVPPSGDDIAQLEQNLLDLGFDPGAVDGTYTSETRQAVVGWQASIGAEEDGIVNLGEVVFLPSAIRISDQLVSVGSAVSPGTPVLAATGSDIKVTVDLPAADQGLIAVGDVVTIELPDNSQTQGTVEFVDTIATVSQAGEAVFEVTIVLDDPTAANGLDEAPVDVDVITDRVDGALAVPVTALVALAEGGYAVEVVDGSGTTRFVSVDPGFYADGLVEITGASLSVGDEVVLP